MIRFHRMADRTVRRCDGCSLCDPRMGRWLSAAESWDAAHRENDLYDGRIYALANTGVASDRLVSGESASYRDGAGHRSVPMPDVVEIVRLDVDRKGNALKPEQARKQARSRGLKQPCPEARYNGLPRGANRDPVWGATWGKNAGNYELPTTTSSARQLDDPRLRRFAKDVGFFDK